MFSYFPLLWHWSGDFVRQTMTDKMPLLPAADFRGRIGGRIECGGLGVEAWGGRTGAEED